MPAIKCIALSNSDQTNEIASYYVVCANNETPRLLSSDLIQIILLVVKQLKLQSGIQGSSKHARNSAKKKDHTCCKDASTFEQYQGLWPLLLDLLNNRISF
jgi:hypothetical protein